MDYHTLAERLMELQAQLHQVPMRQNLSALERGGLFLLNYLLLHENTAHPKELSSGMSVSSARVAALLNHLEGRGLVRRSPDPHDSRQILVSLTEEGRRQICRKREEIANTVAEALKELGWEDAQAFLRIQEQIVKNFRRRIQEKELPETGEGKELSESPP